MEVSTRVRHAQEHELTRLPEVERRADELFTAIGMTGLPPPSSVAELGSARAVLVAGDPPVGFVRLEEVDGRAHIEQLSVAATWTRRGIGTALLRASLRWATEQDYSSVTLITFSDISWNGPFYRRHGFRQLATLSPELADLRQREFHLGLDALGTRVVFYRTVTGRV